MEFIKFFFFQISIIIMPVLFYQIFWSDKKPEAKENRILGTFTVILVTFLCMVFPIQLRAGYHHDLRMIPLIYLILKREYRIACVTAVFMFLFRLYLGGDGMYNFFITFLFNILPCFLISRKYRKYRIYKKVIVAMLVSAWVPICYGITRVIGGSFWTSYSSLTLYIEYVLCHAFAMALLQLLMENIQENQRIRNEMHKLEKISVLSHLAAGVAHEVRNPLTVVRGFIQLTSETEDEKKKMYLGTAMKELDRAEAIIGEYLTFAKPEGKNSSPFNVSAELEKLVSLMDTLGKMNNVELQLYLEHDTYILGDPNKFTQAFMNFIKNGIESMPNGGPLGVIMSKTDKDVTIIIKDEGVGMTPEQVKRLGTPYFSNKEKGTGLGMAVSFRIIEHMRGTIQVQSKVGQGTCFMVTIPTHNDHQVNV